MADKLEFNGQDLRKISEKSAASWWVLKWR